MNLSSMSIALVLFLQLQFSDGGVFLTAAKNM